MEGRAQFEARFVAARLLPGACGWSRRRRGCGVRRARLQVRLDRGVTGGERLLIRVEEFQILLADEDVFGTVVPGERGDDLGLGRVAPIVAVLGERLRVAVAGGRVRMLAQWTS